MTETNERYAMGYDAIVVGARCAGASTALLLARAGHRVLMLERGRFPSDTMSTHYLHTPAVARLDRWGLLDALRATGCPPMTRTRMGLAGIALTGSPPPVDGIDTAYAPRRHVFDSLLAEAATTAGAELRDGCTVTGLVEENGRVVGVRARSGGQEFTERARIVIGADGMDSLVARTVDAPAYEEHPTLTCMYYTYWTGLDADYEIYTNDHRGVGVSATHGGAVVIGVLWPRAEFDRVRHDVEREYLAAMRIAAPELADRVAGATREERFVGTGRLPNFFRQPYGPGWALVGDAGHHKDPVGGYGMSDALAHAELLASRVDQGLRGDRPMEEALAEYAEERDRESMSRFQFNLEAAKLDPLPELLNVLRVVQGDQEQTDRFFGLLAGSVAMEEFFTEELIEKALAAAGVPDDDLAADPQPAPVG
ncbi:MAG TPA: NAD(P)/FAD-dependent oxidoreductase [Micromonospora sp.]